MPKIKRPNFGRYSWIPWYYFYPVWSSFISNTDVSQCTVGLILRRLGSNEVRPSPEMTKNIFLILKIWLITIEGIRSDTLDLTQVRIVVSRIKFFQTQKQDHIRLTIPPEVPPETGIHRPPWFDPRYRFFRSRSVTDRLCSIHDRKYTGSQGFEIVWTNKKTVFWIMQLHLQPLLMVLLVIAKIILILQDVLLSFAGVYWKTQAMIINSPVLIHGHLII